MAAGGSSMRLVLLGILIGLLSAFYPRLPAYLPAPVSRLLPLTSSTTGTNDPAAGSWTKYAKFQARSPPEFEDSPGSPSSEPVNEPKLRKVTVNPKVVEAEYDRSARDKQKAQALREFEERAQAAGRENHLGPELPVYFFDEAASPSWEGMISQIKRDIDPLEHVITIEASPLVNELAIVLSGDEQATARLGETLSEAGFPVRFSEAAQSSFHAVFTPLETATVMLPDVHTWPAAQWYKVGEALHAYRHAGDVFVALGSARPFASQEPSSAFMHELVDVLEQHTAHPREASLAALLSGSAGKPTKGIRSHLTPLLVAVAVADQSEGERTKGGWRFGHLI